MYYWIFFRLEFLSKSFFTESIALASRWFGILAFSPSAKYESIRVPLKTRAWKTRKPVTFPSGKFFHFFCLDFSGFLLPHFVVVRHQKTRRNQQRKLRAKPSCLAGRATGVPKLNDGHGIGES